MISKIVDFSLKNRILILIITLAMAIVGALSFHNLPIEAYPDVADTWVQIITQWPGHASEEVETQITVPIEIAMNGVPHQTNVRSVSLFGLSVVTLIFDEQTPPFTARQYVLEKMSQAQMPTGVVPALGPMSSPVGQVYWYYLDAPGHTVTELKDIEDWELEKRWKQVPGVADVVSFGGKVKQFQALLDPLALANYGITTGNVVQSLSSNNQNAGGGFIPIGDQAYNVRGVGKADNEVDLGNVIVTQKSGTPVRIRNLGQVVVGEQTRLGKISMARREADGKIDDRDDVVEGSILSRTGTPDETVLDGIHEKLKEIQSYLPRDIRVKPFLDRSELIKLTTSTVEENMVSGMVLVLIILLFFLGNIRSALIVATTIPLALLFASILLNVRNIPANLLSLGALDFGMIVDGAVVMVENIFRHKQQQRAAGIDPANENIIELIKAAAKEVERPIVYAIAIIILAYLPIFTLQRVEGRLFTPMAWTVAFALLGALVLVLTVVPVLCAIFLRGELKEWHNPFMHWLEIKYQKALIWTLDRRKLVIGFAIGSFVLTLYLAFGGPIGSEFLPHLDEGSIWVRGTMPPSTSFETSAEVMKKARALIMKFEEVPTTVCQIGRPDDGTDATGFFNLECFVDLKNRKEWRSDYKTKDDLITAMSHELSSVPGVIWNFSQPISDNVEEMMSGVKGALVVKLYGQDLHTLDQKSQEIKKALSEVKGIEDLGIFEELGQPNINIVIDRDKISRYGVNISDVQDVIETAVGGKVASQIIDGEKRRDTFWILIIQ